MVQGNASMKVLRGTAAPTLLVLLLALVSCPTARRVHITDIATSTFLVTGRDADILSLLVAILSTMNYYLEQWKKDEKALILKKRHERSYLLGHHVAVTANDRRSTGTAIAISPEGALVAVGDDGERREFVVGDVERLD